ncbi:class I SAM-dependent methyltransferase [Microlunatus soli]|uniref:Methyltransferase domain-containing protein n=1 Tax=Microlunatus soli TaxID=630515 RepID=A0A1H1VTX2_9ACTN|nr:class I SAM-dependent methyltransferase [Microlunatus soli]SDS88202.1 Methyltransferase domain-containing protein [Microlunatus soli]
MTSSAPDYDRAAAHYDELTGARPDTTATVDFLAEHAGDGKILELGVGTGRIACPLAERGYDVTGLDNSAGMLAKLRARPDGRDVSVVLGSFTDFALESRYSLIYTVFNSLFCVVTQEEQLAAFERAAVHLDVGGRFVVETNLPELSRSDGAGRTLNTSSIERRRVMLEAATHDAAQQRVRSQTVVLSENGIELMPLMLRYIWPSELTLMARLAGFRLTARYGDWDKSRFAGGSQQQISVFELAS